MTEHEHAALFFCFAVGALCTVLACVSNSEWHGVAASIMTTLLQVSGVAMFGSAINDLRRYQRRMVRYARLRLTKSERYAKAWLMTQHWGRAEDCDDPRR